MNDDAWDLVGVIESSKYEIIRLYALCPDKMQFKVTVDSVTAGQYKTFSEAADDGQLVKTTYSNQFSSFNEAWRYVGLSLRLDYDFR